MKIYFLPSVILSAIIGAMLGFVMLIPFINMLACIALLFVAVAVIYYLKKNNQIGFISNNDGTIIGAICGFISIFAAFLIYLPGLFLIGLIFESYRSLNLNISLYFLEVVCFY